MKRAVLFIIWPVVVLFLLCFLAVVLIMAWPLILTPLMKLDGEKDIDA